MNKRFLRILPVLVLMMLLSACNKSADNSSVGINKDGVVEITSIDTPQGEAESGLTYLVNRIQPEDPVSFFNWSIKSPNGLYVYGYTINQKENGVYNWYLREIDFSGKTLRYYDLSWLEPGENINIYSSENNELWVHSYGENKTTGKSFDRIWVYQGQTPEMVLDLSFSAGEYWDEFCVSRDYLIVNTAINSANDRREILYFYDREGNLLFQQNSNNAPHVVLNGDQILLSEKAERMTVISELNVDTQDIREICQFDAGSLRCAEGDDLYISTTTALYKYSVSQSEAKFLFNWNVLGIEIGTIFPMEEDSFFYCSSAGSEPAMAIIKKGTGKERATIVFAVNDPHGTFLATNVNRFNQTNEEYVIEIKNYADYANGQDVFNTEMISGNGPDVILLSDFSDEIIKPEVLADLQPFFEKDDYLNMENVLPGALEAMKTDGALLDFIPAFQIETIVCDSQLPSSLDTASFSAFLHSLQEHQLTGDIFGGSVYRDEFMRLVFCGSNIQPYTTEELMAILSFANQLPADYSYNSNTENQQFSLVCNENTEIFVGEGCAYGADMGVVGLPFYGQNTGIIVPWLGVDLGIARTSSVKDGAWQFFKQLTETEVFEGDILNIIPLNKDKYDYKQREKEKSVLYIDPEDQSDARAKFYESVSEKVREDFYEALLSNLCGILRENRTAYSIVEPLAGQYFSGMKTAEEVAADIISRLSIYYNERR